MYSPSWVLHQKAMTTIENNIVAGDDLFWLRGPSNWSGRVAICFNLPSLKSASARGVPWEKEVKWNACFINFPFWCSSIFLANEKFDFLARPLRATRFESGDVAKHLMIGPTCVCVLFPSLWAFPSASPLVMLKDSRKQNLLFSLGLDVMCSLMDNSRSLASH